MGCGAGKGNHLEVSEVFKKEKPEREEVESYQEEQALIRWDSKAMIEERKDRLLFRKPRSGIEASETESVEDEKSDYI